MNEPTPMKGASKQKKEKKGQKVGNVLTPHTHVSILNHRKREHFLLTSFPAL